LELLIADDTKTPGGLLRYFMKRRELESEYYLVNGCITFICGIMILPDDEDHIPVPASDLGNHLGGLLDCADGSDVSFSVGGETFRAHRTLSGILSL
jgi:speckle-type POZ protein